MRARISKLFYSVGIIFLLTGLLLSIVNAPVVAQEEQPEATPPEGISDEPPLEVSLPCAEGDDEDCGCDAIPIEIDVTLTSAGCEQLIFTVSGTKVYLQSFALHLEIDDASLPYVVSVVPSKQDIIHWGETWTVDVVVTLTEAWKTDPPGTATVTLQAQANGKDSETGEWVSIGYDEASASNEECGYTPSPDLRLEANCPDYTEGLNVWTLYNDGDAGTDYTCTGCSDSGSGYITAGGTELLYGLRTDGTELITVTYGESQIASGDNSGMTDTEAMLAGCPDVPTPGLTVEVEANTPTCTEATFDVTVKNTGSMDLTGVVVNYQADGAAVNGNPTPLSSTLDLLIGGSQTITVKFPVSWTSESTSETVSLTASTMLGDEQISDVDYANNPGNCLTSDLQVIVTAVGPTGCESTQFSVVVKNDGAGTAANVRLDYTAASSGIPIVGAPDPAFITISSLAPGATSDSYTVNVPVNWNNSNDFVNDFVELTASVSLDGEEQGSHSAKVFSPEECYVPLYVTLEVEDMESCEIYPTEVCLDFTLTIDGLEEGSIVTLGEMQFADDGVYVVPVCGAWHGIGLGLERVEISISAAAYLFFPDVAAAAITQIGMGELVAEATGKVVYIPGETECELPALMIQDPFCYATADGYKAAWQVTNSSGFAISFGWVLSGGEPHAATAQPGETVWLGNFDLDATHTVVVDWGSGMDELTAKLTSMVCHAPTPEPPDTPPGPPVPVTAVEAPVPVAEAGVLIPVTGVDLSRAMGLGFFRNLMLYLGLAFLGLAVIGDTIKKK